MLVVIFDDSRSCSYGESCNAGAAFSMLVVSASDASSIGLICDGPGHSFYEPGSAVCVLVYTSCWCCEAGLKLVNAVVGSCQSDAQDGFAF